MGPSQGLLAGKDPKETEDTLDLKEKKVPVMIHIALLDKESRTEVLPAWSQIKVKSCEYACIWSTGEIGSSGIPGLPGQRGPEGPRGEKGEKG